MTEQEKYISLKETLDLCISCGMTRRQAKRWIMKELAKGGIRAEGAIETPEGFNIGWQGIPSKFWRGQWRDNEGDKGDFDDPNIDDELKALAKARAKKRR
jgi:hypothetical protein